MAQSVIATRDSEIETFTLGVGLHAAQTTSAVVRLSPAVNHVFNSLSSYARNIRSEKPEARRKTHRLFTQIQNELAAAVGPERMDLIESQYGPMKIVSDAPIEWLPVGDLPLFMRNDCSRINVTSGSLMMKLLTEPDRLVLHPDDLREILVISAFKDDDPLRTVLKNHVRKRLKRFEKRLDITYKEVKSVNAFVHALNEFEGNILIFDGHGVGGHAFDSVGKLEIAGETTDVWPLHEQVRIPPIVILSSCDTHDIDARSEATVGNAFLYLGARTVLATFLPIEGRAAAHFVARLIYRITEYIPAGLSAKERVLDWTEIIAGMQRMFLTGEILGVLMKGKDERFMRHKVEIETSLAINRAGYVDWYEKLLAAITEHQKESLASITQKARDVLARSESIRYVQLGNPETIIIDDGSIRAQVLKTYNARKDAGAGA